MYPEVRTYVGVPPVTAFGAAEGTPIVINTSTGTAYFLAPGDVVTAIGGGGGTGTVTSVDITAGAGIASSGGPVTTSGSITVALAAIATQRLMANISGGSAAPSANTLTAIIDNILGSTQGQVITRNAANWTVLSPGSSGTFLQSNGAGANLSWGTAGGGLSFWTEAQSTTAPNAVVNVSSFKPLGANADIAGIYGWKGVNGYFAVQTPDGTSTAGNTRGVRAIDFQTDRTASPLAANVASGTDSVLIGAVSSKSSGTGSGGIAVDRATTSGAYSLNTGRQNTNDSDLSFTMGHLGSTRGAFGLLFVRGGGGNSLGETQTMYYPLVADIAFNATAKTLTIERNAVGSTTIPSLSSTGAAFFNAKVVMHSGADVLTARVEGAIFRNGGVATTAMVGTALITYYRTAGTATTSWVVTATADTTNGGLLIKCQDTSAGSVITCYADVEWAYMNI